MSSAIPFPAFRGRCITLEWVSNGGEGRPNILLKRAVVIKIFYKLRTSPVNGVAGTLRVAAA